MQAELGGAGQGWTNIAADVQQVPQISIDYGIPGAGPTDLVGSTGTMTFALNNGKDNSGGLVGYYSPAHANCRSGFAIGIGIRLVYRLAGVTYYKFSGTLDSIDPISGTYGERKVLCTAVDWMDEAATYKPNVATQISKRADEILTALVAAVPRQPKALDFDTGDSTFLYALDTDSSDLEPTLTTLQRLAQSEYGRIYVKGDTNTGGVLTFESRTARLAPVSAATFNDTMISVSAPYQRSLLINKVKTATHPRIVDAAATTILFQLVQVNPSVHTVSPGETLVIEGSYTDIGNPAKIGGTDMVTPVATTDYTMNTLATGAGTDLTASFAVSAEYGANRVKYTILNNSASVGYITKLEGRGRGLYDYGPVESISSDTDSITAYGERTLSMDMPYGSDVQAALTVGQYILSAWASPSAVAMAMPLIPPTSTSLATMIAREPGDAITVTETVTGLSAVYFINHVSMRFETVDIINFEWTLQKALAFPVVRSRVVSAVTTDQTSHTVTMPSGIVAGDLLVCCFASDDNNLGTADVAFPAGWTDFGRQWAIIGAVEAIEMVFAYRRADGTEGSSITVTTGAAQESTHATFRIAGAADPAVRAPEAGTFTNSGVGDTLVTPPTLTPTGGVKNYLWIAVGGISIQGGGTLGYTIPATYGNPQFQSANLDGWSILTMERTYRAATTTPGATTLNLSRRWMAGTIAIHPATT